MFIKVEKEGASVFLDKDSIMKLSVSKDASLKQSERLVKVEFKNGTTGTYTINRRAESSLSSSLTGIWSECSPVECSVEEVSIEEAAPALA